MNQPDIAQLWTACLGMIAQKIDASTMKSWFEPIEPLRLYPNEEGGMVLVLKMPSEAFFSYFGSHFSTVLYEAMRACYQGNIALEVEITEEAPMPAASVAPTVTTGTKSSYGGIMSEHLRFETFYESECNRYARQLGEMIAARPGQGPYNIAFFFGPSGVGKTHLCQAIGLKSMETDSSVRVCYIPSSEFESQFVTATKAGRRMEFIQFYQQIDILIIDDIQGLIGKKSTQQAFFEIFNHLTKLNKQIIITSDMPPSELNGLEERMITRIQSSVTIPLERPDSDLRSMILHKKAEVLKLDIPREVLDYIAQLIGNNVRELEGVIKTLKIRQELTGCAIDLPFAMQVMGNAVKIKQIDITLDRILEAVASEFDVEIPLIKGNTRTAKVALPRQVAMYMSKKYLDYSYNTIAERLGRKNHTTVMHGVKEVQKRLNQDAEFKAVIDRLEQSLRA